MVEIFLGDHRSRVTPPSAPEGRGLAHKKLGITAKGTEVYTIYEIEGGTLPRNIRHRGKCEARKGGVEPDADDAGHAGMPSPNTIKK
jgi:hypothetical protein